MSRRQQRFIVLAGIMSLILFSQACVGKFLSTMLSNEGANFKVIDATPTSNTQIRVSFNKPLDYTGSESTNKSNYSIPGLNIVSMTKGAETHQVLLNLDPADSIRMQRISYTLTVNNVVNQTLDPLLADGRSVTFTGTRWLRAVCQNDDGTSSCPPIAATGGATIYTVKVRGDYAVGSNYRWQLYNLTTSAPVLACLNPRNTNHPTCNNNAQPTYDNFEQNGACNNPQHTNYPACTNAAAPGLDNGRGTGPASYDWSPVTPVATGFYITNLPTANLRLSMQVQDAQGAWQPTSDYTTYDFFVDSTPPINIGLTAVGGPSATPAYTTTTNVTVTNVNVRPRSCTEFPLPAPNCSASPEAPSHYKYRMRYTAGACPGSGSYGSWSSEVSANIPLTYLMTSGDGCYNFQFVSRDQANNYQCDTSKVDGDVTACPLFGTGTITDFFNNKPWQVANFQLDTTPPQAVFNVNTLPAFDTGGPMTPPYNNGGSTASTSLTAEVQSSASVPYYRYRITGPGQAGVWSNDKVSGAGGVANPFISGNPPGEYISVSGLTNGGTFTVEIIGKDPAGNYQSTSSPTSYTFTVDTSVPTAVLTAYTGAGGCVGQQGLPNNPTNNNCVSVTVGGAGVTHYKAAIVSGASCPNTDGSYSAAAAVGTNYINLSPGFASGTTYSLCVRGGASVTGPFGLAPGEITRHTFAFDSTPPTGTAVKQFLTPAYATAPASASIFTVYTDTNLIIGENSGEAVLAYKGDIYAGPTCPAIGVINALTEKSVYTPLQKTGLTPSATPYLVCFIGRDAAGNYQTTVQSYSYMVFTPSTPSDGGGANDNAYVTNFNYTWTGVPNTVTEIRIRICTDAACTSPIPGFQNGVAVCSSAATCAATTSYNVVSNCTGLGCIKPLNGASYFAQLRVTDASGTVSNFGSASDGKIVTGGITGIIRDTNGNPVNGATVTLRQSGCGAAIGGNLTTTGTGVFTFSNGSGHNIPISLAATGYCIQASTTGPTRQGEKRFINVDPATNTNVGNVYVVDSTGTGCIIGSLVDGSTGSQLSLSNATFTLKDWNGNTISGAPALDPDGKQFVFPAACLSNWNASPYTAPTYTYASGLSSGVYSLDVAVPNYYSVSESSIGVTNNKTVHTGYLPMVGTFAGGSQQIKVILTWGNTAKDLDLHVTGPTTGVDCTLDNEAAITGDATRFHTYFQQRNCTQSGNPTPFVQLAVDDTYEFGPEIINFNPGYAATSSVYKISVFNNDTLPPSRNGTLTNGSPTVTALSTASTDLVAGMRVQGAGVQDGTTILSVDSGTQITLSANATAAGATPLYFSVDWTQTKARVYIYAGNFFTGGGGLMKTISNHTTSAARSGTLTNASTSVTGITSTADLVVGMPVFGTGVPVGARIAAIPTGTSITLSINATTGGAQTLSFAAVRGWKPLRMTVNGSTITFDDNTGSTYGYADWRYGVSQVMAGTRSTGSPTITFAAPLSTALLVPGLAVSGTGVSGTVSAITSATTINLSANAGSNGTNNITFTFNACSAQAPFAINGPSDGLTAGAAPAAGTNPKDPNLNCGLLLNGTTTAGGVGPLDW